MHVTIVLFCAKDSFTDKTEKRDRCDDDNVSFIARSHSQLIYPHSQVFLSPLDHPLIQSAPQATSPTQTIVQAIKAWS